MRVVQSELEIWNRGLSRLGDLRIGLATALTGVTATAANPVVCTKASHGYATGELLLAQNFVQMTPLNGRVFRVTVLTANTFELDGEDGSTYTAESTGGRTRKLTDPNGGTLGKHGDATFDAWPAVRDEVLSEHPWNGVVRYLRCARLAAAKTITAATAANPVVLTIAAHGYSAGDYVLVETVGGMVELNDRYFQVGLVPTVNTFQLSGEDGTAHTAYTSGGTAKKANRPLKPDHNFLYRYDLPSDCVRVLELVDSREPWEVVGLELYTDEGITVPIRYIRRQKDVTRYSAGLVNAMARRLAFEMCEELTQNTTKDEGAERKYRGALAAAKASDGMEQSPSALDLDEWELERL